MAARFVALNKGGQLSNARTEILPHQIFTAFSVVSSPRRRFMLADEVGLGKTIEAGMVWQALAKDKFQADFEIFGRDFAAVNPRMWDLKAAAIASLDRLKRKEHKRTLLENRKWDLIIFDEAHRLSARDYPKKTEKTQNYQLAEVLRECTDALLLLTATHHAGDPNHPRFINLVRLLEPNVDFSPLIDEGLFRPEGAVHYSDLILRTPKLKVTDAEGKVVFKGRRTVPLGFSMYPDEKKFYQAVEEYIRTGYNSLNRSKIQCTAAPSGLAALARVLAVPRHIIDELLAGWSMHDWRADPFTRGAYVYVGVGGIAAQKTLAKPVEGTLFFAGEATDPDQHGCGCDSERQTSCGRVGASAAPAET